MKNKILGAVIAFISIGVSAEKLILKKSDVLEICSNIEKEWEKNSRLNEKRQLAISYVRNVSNLEDKIILIEKGGMHYRSYSYRAFLLAENDFSFVYYDSTKKGYATRKISYKTESSAMFLDGLFSRGRIEDTILSFDNMPKDLIGTCYKVTMHNGNAKSSVYYLNSTLDIEKNKRPNFLELKASSNLRDLINYLVFFGVNK